MSYGYTYNTQNRLEYKTDYRINQKEHYTYSDQNSLTNWDILNATTNIALKVNSAGYDAMGNISSKSDLNIPNDVTLNYEEPLKPHKLTSISGVTSAIPATSLSVTYTDFRKVKTLTEGSKTYDISYGVDEQRRKSVYKENGVTKLTRYYLGDYEEESDTLGNIKKYHYLSGGAVMINNNGVETLYYGYTDFQGSLVALTDENGTIVERYAYDPWGARRNPDNWTLPGSPPIGDLGGLNRGYTGHEHLDAFGIINMNGRVYDPATAQFFSPDPFVQSPGDWNNYNRYAYCLNNPVMYTDPSGYQQMLSDENNNIKWSFQDEMARTERELGLGTGGNTSIFSYLSAFNKAFQNGYKSDFTQFMRDVDKQASNSDFNGQLTFSYTTQEKSTVKNEIKRVGNLEFKITDLIVYPIINHSFTINLWDGGNPQGQGGNYFEDARVYTLNFGHFKNGAAMTIPGVGIFVGPGDANNIDLLRHEYGHILQYKKWGTKIFWGEIVPASLKSANKANSDWSFNHMDTWTEWSANRLSYQYFNQPTDWSPDYPIWPTTIRPGVMPPFIVGPYDFKYNWLDN